MTFKCRLEEKVLGPKPNHFNSHTDNKDFELGIGSKELVNKPKQGEDMLLVRIGDEIRTPINAITETVDLLKEGHLTEEQLVKINSIASSSNHLLDIINELLEYTKLTSGREEFENIDFNFYGIIKDTVYLCNTLITNNDVTLEVELDTEIPEFLMGDPSRLSQILLTLLGNSIKPIDKGSILLKIKPRRQQSNYLVLDFEVRDLRKEAYTKDLKYNVSATEASNVNDLGIDFAMVKGILEMLNGSLATMATLDNGCVYKFTIPYKKSKQSKEHGNCPDSINTLQNHRILDGLHIVVFEDNIPVQKLIEQRLKNWGCTVHITGNSEAGLDYLSRNRVDLVLMDIGIPVMNGFQIAQIIRESDNNHVKNIPIIALTGDFNMNIKNKCSALGIDNYILKPYSHEELLTTLYKYKREEGSRPLFNTGENLVPFAAKKEVWEVCLSNILEECMGEIDLLEELIGLFKQNMLDFIGRANIYIPEGNFNGLGFAAHKVKTGLSMMKADYLFSLVEKITIGCRTHRNLPEIGRLYDQLLSVYPIVEKAIDKELMILKRKGN